MSDLVLDCEHLNKAIEGSGITKEQAVAIYDFAAKHPEKAYAAASELRNRHRGSTVTFSKKAFFNLVNLCRDTCGYCTYKSEPASPKLSMMSKKSVRELAALAKKYRCTEALFVTGERPEEKYAEARAWLSQNGFSSTAEYLVHASEAALEEGLLPHTNAGNLTRGELAELKRTNASMGLMLESSSERLMQDGMPHHLAPSKDPAERLGVLRNAGSLGIPMTTGILLGIGETPIEAIESIFAIKRLHEEYGHIQEIILQNFRPKEDTVMRRAHAADESYFKIIVAITRMVMPKMNIQIPPNLSPESYQSFLQAGVNDWGGISPLTQDHVNPEFSWPQIEFVERHTKNAGFELRARFPVYPEFVQMINVDLRGRMSEMSDGNWLVREDLWR